MAGTGIMAGIYSSPSPSPYPIEKIGNSPHPYTYPINAGIPCQNGDRFRQYSRGRVFLPSLLRMYRSTDLNFLNLIVQNLQVKRINLHLNNTPSIGLDYYFLESQHLLTISRQ